MKIILFIILAFFNLEVLAAGDAKDLPNHNWSFEGLTGKFDKSIYC